MSLFRSLLKKTEPPVLEHYFSVTVGGGGGTVSYSVGYGNDYGNITPTSFFVTKRLSFYISGIGTSRYAADAGDSNIFLTFLESPVLLNNKSILVTRLDNNSQFIFNNKISKYTLHYTFGSLDVRNEIFSFSDLNKVVKFKLNFY